MKNKITIAVALAASVGAHAGPVGSPGNDVGRWPVVQAAEPPVSVRSAAGLAGIVIPPAPAVEPRASTPSAVSAAATPVAAAVPRAAGAPPVVGAPAAPSPAAAVGSSSKASVLPASALPPKAVEQQDHLGSAMMAKLTVMRNKIAGTTSDIVTGSKRLLGIKYKWGGVSEEEGFDCSSFVREVFARTVGLVLPRTAAEQARATEAIDKGELIPGDLVFFNTLRREFSHVGIYVGEGRFIHAPRTGASIRVENMNSSYWAKRFNGARRVSTAEERED